MTPCTPIESTITIHTDGACKGNPGPGAWAVIIEDEHQRLFLADRVVQTTNQRMELSAVIKALETLKKQAADPYGWSPTVSCSLKA